MSHKYGDRFPGPSQGHLRPSPPSESDILSRDQAEDAPATQAKTSNTPENITDSITDSESNRTEASKDAPPLPSPDDMNSWTLTQFRAHLEDVVIEKRRATGQTRVDLESRRLLLIDRITRIERAALRKRDAARRVVIGRDVAAPPPDPVEKPWRKKRFGPNTRRSGPEDAPQKVKKEIEEEGENPEEELHSKRWKLKRKRVLGDEDEQEEGEEEEEAAKEVSEGTTDEEAGQGAEHQEDGQNIETEERAEATHGMEDEEADILD